MEILKNRKKYYRYINKIKSEGGVFSDFLEHYNLSVIEYLTNCGLNKNILTPFNYEEIESLINDFFSNNEIPILSHPLDGFNAHNKATNSTLAFNDDSIIFSKYYQNILLDEHIDGVVNDYYQIYDNKGIFKLTYTIEERREENNPQIKELKILSHGDIYDLNGQHLGEENYKIRIKRPINYLIFNEIYKGLNQKNIPYVYEIVDKYIKERNLNEDDAEIERNVSLYKKSF